MTAPDDRSHLFTALQPSNGQGKRPISKILIANRGEIACRVIRTCRILNITSVVIFVDEDVPSRHILEADEAVNIGNVETSEVVPYLNIPPLEQTARKARADAIHPGYGYLSENAAFADAVREVGIIFIGPHRAALSTLGDKRTAKAFLSEYAPDVPLIPGFKGVSQAVAELEAAAEEIGYPVMIKASAGGGGKGMRVVRSKMHLKEELERAQSESRRSFGSTDCILERYIDAGKHVEFQIFGDSHGQVSCFWERDRSVQRRNQKIIEETPCTWLTDELRQSMKESALRIARLLGYEGAGTVEFIVDVKTREFFFLEVNARLQVEHPITEEVTGFDLVALQIYVAAGGRLDDLPSTKSIPQLGHAIECRLCAETPEHNFRPGSGPINLWSPALASTRGSSRFRFETAVDTGSTMSIHFDPMVAKIVVWEPTRSQAIESMLYLLKHSACIGLETN